MKKKLLSILLILCLLPGCIPALAPSAAAAEKAEPVLSFGETISAGYSHMAVIKEDGSLWTWGRNTDNRLGIGAAEDVVSSPIQVPVGTVISVSSGTDTTSVITADGELWNWGGSNMLGALGRGTRGDNTGPGRMMEGVWKISSSGPHSAAVTYDGTLWTWGRNNDGQLGNNRQGTIAEGRHRSYLYEALPVRAMENVRSVETGSGRTFAILNDSSLWGWGDNQRGALGSDSSVWEEGGHDDSLLGVTDRWSEVYDEDYTWEGPDGFQLIFEAGEPVAFTSIYQPVPIKIMEDAAKVSSDYYTVILKNDGSVWTCGQDRQLPDGRHTYAPEHVLDGAVDVAAGGRSFAAIKEDGGLWTWGDNLMGTLGRGFSSFEEGPAKIMEDVVSVTVGNDFMAALKGDGSLWMWGSNENGQLGVDREEPYLSSPVKVMDGVALPARTGRAASPALAEQPIPAGGPSEPAATGAPAPWMKIPSGAGYFGGNSYAFWESDYTWQEAEAFCEQQGGHLVTVSSDEEFAYLQRMPFSGFYVGAFADSAGNWRWVTGEQWAYTNWAPADPNYPCLIMSGGQYYAHGGIDSPGGFICEWGGGRTYTIRFDASGGAVSTASKQVYNGYTCGPLPVPVRSGYNFLGWFTGDGRQLTADAVIQTDSDVTAYAKWAVSSGGPSVLDISYSFSNSAQSFNYPAGYRIPPERYTYMFGNNNAAWNAYNSLGAWGGSCFGMVNSAASLYMSKNPTPNGELTLDAYSQSEGLTLLQIIESMQISQLSNRIQKTRNQNHNAYAPLVQAVLNFQNTGTQPVSIGLVAPTGGGMGGHELMGLAVYRDAGKKKDVIQVYDPNFPGDMNRWIDLYWSAPDEYTGWYYHFNDNENWGTAYSSKSYLNFVVYSDVAAVWNNRGTSAALTADTLSMNTANASVYDCAGNLAAVIRDGEAVSSRGDIFVFADPVNAGTDSSGSGTGVTLWVPSEHFVVVNEDPGVDELTVTMSGEASAVTVTTSSDRALVYTSGDSGANMALVNGKDESYEMVFRSREGGEIRLSGVTEEGTPACFAQMSGKLSGMGVSVGENSRLSIDGKEGSAGDVAQTTVVSAVTSTAASVISSVFADVPGGSYYAPAVQWAYDAGIVKETALGVFDPDHAYTRGEAAVLLWRALGRPVPADAGQIFSDAGEDDDSYQAVLWAAGAGIAAGVGGNRFAPEQTCSDWEFLTFLWRALGSPGQGAELAGYDDAMAWAEDRGLLRDSDAQPPCLRRDAVTFLYRALA